MLPAMAVLVIASIVILALLALYDQEPSASKAVVTVSILMLALTHAENAESAAELVSVPHNARRVSIPI